jgi:DHA1 family bicyclomycin/chloramphenicol resistance-like MFS transporter
LQPGSGATPLLTIMVMSAAGSLASILWVLRRERRLGTIRHTTTGS